MNFIEGWLGGVRVLRDDLERFDGFEGQAVLILRADLRTCYRRGTGIRKVIDVFNICWGLLCDDIIWFGDVEVCLLLWLFHHKCCFVFAARN